MRINENRIRGAAIERNFEMFLKITMFLDKPHYTQESPPEKGRQFRIGIITNF